VGPCGFLKITLLGEEVIILKCWLGLGCSSVVDHLPNAGFDPQQYKKKKRKEKVSRLIMI
jgi:hypothetical protein